jgi:hypothetical protein
MTRWGGTVILPGPACLTCGAQAQYIDACVDGVVKGTIPVTFHWPGCPDGPAPPDKGEEEQEKRGT